MVPVTPIALSCDTMHCRNPPPPSDRDAKDTTSPCACINLVSEKIDVCPGVVVVVRIDAAGHHLE